jgi:hypothetical protein
MPATALLTVELVPSTCWESNVRALVSTAEWDRIRKQTGRSAGSRCEICGGVGPKHPVECHEVWHYDDTAQVQGLVRMIALCPACHEVKHFGRAQLAGRVQDALDHLMRVNGWQMAEARAHVRESSELYKQRSPARVGTRPDCTGQLRRCRGCVVSCRPARGDTSRRIRPAKT